MGFPSHLDVHDADFPAQFPCVGEITAVVASDVEANFTETITLYQVKLLLQKPFMPVVLPAVPCAGTCAGFGNESDRALTVGQRVIVLFLEADPQRPVILNTFPYVGPKSTPEARQTASLTPQSRFIFNGVETLIDKQGTVELKMAEEQHVRIRDSNDNILLQLRWDGAAYKIELGGSTGLMKLLKETAADVYNNHHHLPGTLTAPGGGGAVTGATAGPSATIGASDMTDVTLAK